VEGYATPEEAARADGVPPQFARVVVVEHSPDRRHAVVLIEYNEPPHVEPYVVLCQHTPGGWTELGGGSAGGLTWMSTSEDGAVGVVVAWGHPPTITWDAPAWGVSGPGPYAGRW
jgi:hypothetical protein